jgi:hypothetical protein
MDVCPKLRSQMLYKQCKAGARLGQKSIKHTGRGSPVAVTTSQDACSA